MKKKLSGDIYDGSDAEFYVGIRAAGSLGFYAIGGVFAGKFVECARDGEAGQEPVPVPPATPVERPLENSRRLGPGGGRAAARMRVTYFNFRKRNGYTERKFPRSLGCGTSKKGKNSVNN